MLSIIITHYQTPVLLELCLKALSQNKGRDGQIIVVDSQSEEKTKELIEENFPQVEFIGFKENVGYAKLVNAGLKQAQGDYLLILNADILILPGAIEKMIEFMEKNPSVGLIGPQLMTFAHQPQPSCFRFPSLATILARRTFLGKLNWGKKQLAKFLIKPEENVVAQPVDWIQGSAMLVRREALEKVGFFDERFFMYFEDTDWCRRFWQAGYQVVYLPAAKMSHYYYQASKRWGGFLDLFLNKYTQLHLISALKYFWKWRHNQKRASEH